MLKSIVLLVLTIMIVTSVVSAGFGIVDKTFPKLSQEQPTQQITQNINNSLVNITNNYYNVTADLTNYAKTNTSNTFTGNQTAPWWFGFFNWTSMVSWLSFDGATLTANTSALADVTPRECSGYGVRALSADGYLGAGGASASGNLGCVYAVDVSLIELCASTEVSGFSVAGTTTINMSVGAVIKNPSVGLIFNGVSNNAANCVSFNPGIHNITAETPIGFYQDRVNGTYSASSNANARFVPI